MNKNTVLDLLRNKKVLVGGVGLLSIGVLAMYLLQKPQELSQINEVKTTQIK